MRLLRAAFETKDTNVICMAVLCTGCFHGVLAQLDQADAPTRRWIRPVEGDAECEFCTDEVRRSAVE